VAIPATAKSDRYIAPVAFPYRTGANRRAGLASSSNKSESNQPGLLKAHGTTRGRGLRLVVGIHRLWDSFFKQSLTLILGNPAYLTRAGWSAVAKARREEGTTTSTITRTEISTPTVAAAFNEAFGAAPTPGPADRPPSMLTRMVSHRPHFLSIHKSR
jgi:hypothetical protein